MTFDDVARMEPKLTNVYTIGRAKGISNAYAVIKGSERLLVYDPSLIGSWAGVEWNLIMGHEAGHHLCGHTAGRMVNDPWRKELEADHFSGMFLRVTESKYGGTISQMLTVAANKLGPGGGDHPPANPRLQAIHEGYETGSACGVTVHDVTITAQHPELGLDIVELNVPTRRQYGFPEDKRGIIVTKVVPNSPAEKSGLQAGDEIYTLQGQQIDTVYSFNLGLAMAGTQNRSSLNYQRITKGGVRAGTLYLK